MDRVRGRQVRAVRSRSRTTRSAPGSPGIPSIGSPAIDLSRVSPSRMLAYLRETGHLPEPSAPPPTSLPGTSTPSDPAALQTFAVLEALFQRVLASSVAPAPAPASTASVPTAAPTNTTGKPTLKFPDPPCFEGDPAKLDGWITQTHMYLRAYDVDLGSSRAVDVATMFLRAKAQDWWTGQFHLQESGATPALSSWDAFVQALTAAFRPVELDRKYIDQLLRISQGKQDMRTYIATFNALRAKVPEAFSEALLSHLFLHGCRPDLIKSITLQYPKTLAEYFQHAIALSDLPSSQSKPSKAEKADQSDKSDKASKPICSHCSKPGHTADRCFQLHPELKKKKTPSSSKT